MCCSVGFARSLGLALLPLALCCILANLLLLFPMGEVTYIEQGRLASYIWYFGGLGGGGLLMLVPAVTFITLGKCSCCWNQSLMMCGSVLAAVVGLVGASYCFVVSGLALMQGPLCFTSLGWSYPFADQGGSNTLDWSPASHGVSAAVGDVVSVPSAAPHCGVERDSSVCAFGTRCARVHPVLLATGQRRRERHLSALLL